MKAIILFLAMLTSTFFAYSQTAQVLCHQADFKCRNCSNTGRDTYAKKVIRVIEGDSERVDKQILYSLGTYPASPKEKSCNNTNYWKCDFVKVSETDCTVELDFNGLDFSPFGYDNHDRAKEIGFWLKITQACK